MDKPAVTFEERRKRPRILVRIPVELRFGDGEVCRGQCLNLSANGALIAVPRQIPLGEEFEILLELPDGKEPLAVRALSLRLDGPAGGGPPYRLGLHFILPTGADTQRIRELIYDS